MKPHETTAQCVERKLGRKLRLIRVARGEEPADIVFKNATYLNVFSNDFCHGDIAVSDGLIAGIGSYHGSKEVDVSGSFVCPGLIDAHIHLESSLVSPAEFARAVIRHGTTTVITDPHEIANVMGVDGIRYMLEATEGLPVDVHFMLPSCVPATPLDESGCTLDYQAIDDLYDHSRVLGLAEMMNYVGVINGDPAVISKILASQAHHKKIDGHAPDLSGADLNAYIAAGVYSDHECSTCQDALEKLQLGQFIMIREGTAAQNLRALLPLLNQQYYSRCMFATDDKHPLDLLQGGHIDYIIREAIACGVDPIIAIKVASHQAARYFLMNNKGAIAPGYLADLVVFDNFRHFNIQEVYKRGRCVFADGEVLPFDAPAVEPSLSRRAHETFRIAPVTPQQLAAGDLPGLGVDVGSHAHLFQIGHRVSPGFLTAPLQHLHLTDHAVFQNGHIVEQVKGLEHHAYLSTIHSELFESFIYIRTTVINSAGSRMLQIVHAADKRRLAAAGRTDDADNIAATDIKADAL